MSIFQGLFRPPNLEELRAKGDVKGLIKALGYKKDDHVQQFAIDTLVEIGAPAVEPLITALRGDDDMRRGYAVEALGKIGALAVGPLISSLRDLANFNDKDIRACTAIATALGKVGAPAVEPLIAVLCESVTTDSALDLKRVLSQGYATDALGYVGAPAVEPLVAALKDGDWLLRQNAIKALGKTGDARSVEPLILALGVRLTRKEAVEALGRIGDKRAVEPLISTLSDENEEVVFAAIESLGKLGDRRALKPIIAASEKRLEVSRKALKMLNDQAKVMGRSDFGRPGIFQSTYDAHNKVVQEALTRLRLPAEEAEAGATEAGAPPRKDGKDHAQAVAHVQAGIDLCKSQEWDRAIPELKQAVEIEPDFAKAHQLLAICYGAKLETESAVEHFQILRKLDANMAKELEDNPLFAMVLKGRVLTTD